MLQHIGERIKNIIDISFLYLLNTIRKVCKSPAYLQFCSIIYKNYYNVQYSCVVNRMLQLNIEIIALYLNLLERNISNYILNFLTILVVIFKIFILFYLKRYDHLFRNNSILYLLYCKLFYLLLVQDIEVPLTILLYRLTTGTALKDN